MDVNQENIVLINIDAVIFDSNLYPRKDIDPEEVNRLAELLADGVVLPPIDINQEKKLLDGRHRLMAHKKNGRKEIRSVFHVTKNEYEDFLIACRKNSDHGRQLTREERNNNIHRLYKQACDRKGPYGAADGNDLMIIARSTGVCVKTVRRLTQEARKEIKDARDQVVKQLTDQGETKKKISENLRLPRTTVRRAVEEMKGEGGQNGQMSILVTPTQGENDLSEASRIIREEREKYGVTLQYFKDKFRQVEKLVKEYRMSGDCLRNELIQFCQDVKDPDLKREIDRIIQPVLDDHDEFYAMYKRSNVIKSTGRNDSSKVVPIRQAEAKTAGL